MILATTRGNKAVEHRASIGGMYGNGFAYTDFSAIPPPGLGEMQRAGVLVTADTLLQLDVVFTSLRLITTAILRTGNLRAYEDKLDKDNIPYRKYLKKQPSLLTATFLGANGKVYQYDGRRKTLMSMALFGEAFWYILTRSKPEAYASAIEVLHPAFMEVKIASPQDVSAGRASNVGESMYIYGAANDKKLLDPGDVVHIPFMSMPQARRGLSTVRYAGISGALALAAYEFGSTWFSQGASPSWLLTTDQKLGTAEVERIADKFMIGHSGLDKAHHPLVLDSGIKPEKALASPDEAQYLNPLDVREPILTGTGWKTMGTVETGDIVYAEDGSPTPVIGTSPVFPDRECFELEFTDGAKVVASGDHRWHVWDPYSHQAGGSYKGDWKTLSTNEIAASWQWYGGKNRYRVKCDSVVASPAADLPIDPYLFGYWLGDGTSRDTSITVGRRDCEHLEAAVARAGLRVTTTRALTGGTFGGESLRVRFVRDGGKGLRQELRELGVLGNKHIPDVYLTAAPEQRRALLAGLLDSDGSSGPRVRFTSTIPALAEGMLTLARSLGIRTNVRWVEQTPRAGVAASKRKALIEWVATFDPFRMARKSENVELWKQTQGRGASKDLRRMSIVGVRQVESRPTRCIAIEHPCKVFLVGRTFVPTGNTLQYARSVVAAWFGTDELIPDALLRQTPAPAHTAQEKMQRFTTLTLSGYTTPLEEVHSDLLPGEQKAAVEEHKLLTPDPQFLAQEIETLRNTQVATANEIRVRKLGWAPSADPAADELVVPLASNVSPAQTGGGKASKPDPKDEGDEPKDTP